MGTLYLGPNAIERATWSDWRGYYRQHVLLTETYPLEELRCALGGCNLVEPELCAETSPISPTSKDTGTTSTHVPIL